MVFPKPWFVDQFQGFLGNDPVIERNRQMPRGLIGFMTFSGYQNHVPVSGNTYGHLDGPGTVGFDNIAFG